MVDVYISESWTPPTPSPSYSANSFVYFEAGKTSCISGSSRDRSVTVPETPGVTHEQYQATVAAARERMAELKRLEAVG